MNSNEQNSLNDSFIEAPIPTLSHSLHPTPGTHGFVERNNINLLTYNIFLRPPLIKNNKSDYKDERLKEFIKVIGDFDIICLQQMFGFLSKRRDKLIKCAKKAGFLYHSESPIPSIFTSFVADGGVLTLSRFPILVSEFKPYAYGMFPDGLCQKGVLYNKIQIKDEILHIYNTNTQASYSGKNEKYPIYARSDQFKALRQFMVTTLQKNNYKNGELILLLGDLNVDGRKPYVETSEIKQYPGFRVSEKVRNIIILKDFSHLGRQEYFSEYEAMLCYLSDNHKDTIEDLLFESYGEHPITYADSYIDDNRELKPRERILTCKDDLCSNQSLDYIFKLNPKSLKNIKNDLREVRVLICVEKS